MKNKYIITSLFIPGLFVASAQGQVLATWSADADASGPDITWTDSSANTNDLTFKTTNNLFGSNSDGVPVTGITGQSFTSAYSFGDRDDPAGAGVSGSFFSGETVGAGEIFQVDVMFNADNITQKSTLFSDGGLARGYSLNLDGGNLRFLLKEGQGNGDDSKVNLLSSTAVTAGSWNLATVQISSDLNTVDLFLNGSNVGTITGTTIGDFTGNNHTAIGMYSGSQDQIGGADNAADADDTDLVTEFSAFTGDVAYVEVAIVPEPSAFGLVFGGLAILFVGSRRRRA